MLYFLLLFTISVVICEAGSINTHCHKNEVNNEWAIYTDHTGCMGDIKGNLDFFGIKSVFHRCEQHWDFNTIQVQLCEKYPVIVISDVLTFAINILKAIVHGYCKYTKFIFHITNRFDYEHENQYLDIFEKLTRFENVFWVPNNEFELEWLRLNGLLQQIIDSKRLIITHPSGYYESFPQELWPPKTSENKVAYLKRTLFDEKFFQMFEDMQLFYEKVDIYGINSNYYKGPENLSSYYEWIFYIPYQFSTFKLFENFRTGLIQVVPSPNLLKDIVWLMNNENSPEYSAKQMHQLIFIEHQEDWEEYFHVYSRKYRDMVKFFDSWEQARNWVRNGIDNLEEIRNKNKIRVKMIDEENLKNWRKLFSMMNIDEYIHS